MLAIIGAVVFTAFTAYSLFITLETILLVFYCIQCAVKVPRKVILAVGFSFVGSFAASVVWWLLIGSRITLGFG